MNKYKYFQAIVELQQQKTLSTISVRDITKHMGITTGALYYHFKNKNDLLNQMFCYYREKTHNFLIEHNNDSTEQFLYNHINYCLDNKDTLKLNDQIELEKYLTHYSILFSRKIHIELVNKLGIEYDKTHKKTIVLGSINSLILKPSFHDPVDI